VSNLSLAFNPKVMSFSDHDITLLLVSFLWKDTLEQSLVSFQQPSTVSTPAAPFMRVCVAHLYTVDLRPLIIPPHHYHGGTGTTCLLSHHETTSGTTGVEGATTAAHHCVEDVSTPHHHHRGALPPSLCTSASSQMQLRCNLSRWYVQCSLN
jgi:hypothetical protein